MYVVGRERRKVSDKKKMGRPIKGQPKNIRVELRFDKNTLDKLDKLRAKEKMTRSEYIRHIISKN